MADLNAERVRAYIARLFHPGKEWDARYGQWVRRGWIAERQTIMDRDYRYWQEGRRLGGTCLQCCHPIDDHPMPDRLWRSGHDLCDRVEQRHIDGSDV